MKNTDKIDIDLFQQLSKALAEECGNMRVKYHLRCKDCPYYELCEIHNKLECIVYEIEES